MFGFGCFCSLPLVDTHRTAALAHEDQMLPLENTYFAALYHCFLHLSHFQSSLLDKFLFDLFKMSCRDWSRNLNCVRSWIHPWHICVFISPARSQLHWHISLWAKTNTQSSKWSQRCGPRCEKALLLPLFKGIVKRLLYKAFSAAFNIFPSPRRSALPQLLLNDTITSIICCVILNPAAGWNHSRW